MHTRDWYDVQPMTLEQCNNALADLAIIARGEKLDMPWRRLRILLDHKLVEINHPVLSQGSWTSIGFTDEGLRFLEQRSAGRRRRVHVGAGPQANRRSASR